MFMNKLDDHLQLFRERLSGKVHATILKGTVGGFEFSFFQRNLKELARKAMTMCLRVLMESYTKVGSTATVVRNSVLIISHITFRDCRVHIFSDNLSRNSCIWQYGFTCCRLIKADRFALNICFFQQLSEP